MPRDDLLGINLKVRHAILRGTFPVRAEGLRHLHHHPPRPMVWARQKACGLPKNFSSALLGVLDAATFVPLCPSPRSFKVPRSRMSPPCVLGGHGDTMVPAGALLDRRRPFPALPREGLATGCAHRTCCRWTARWRRGERHNLLKTGSAFYALASWAISMAESYLKDQIACSLRLLSQTANTGVKGTVFGAPSVIGAKASSGNCRDQAR